MSFKENFNESIERMKVKSIQGTSIAMARLYYSNRHKFTHSRDVAQLIGVPTGHVRQIRRSLVTIHGYKFKSNDNGFKLVDVTLEKDSSYLEMLRRQREKRKRRFENLPKPEIASGNLLNSVFN